MIKCSLNFSTSICLNLVHLFTCCIMVSVRNRCYSLSQVSRIKSDNFITNFYFFYHLYASILHIYKFIFKYTLRMITERNDTSHNTKNICWSNFTIVIRVFHQIILRHRDNRLFYLRVIEILNYIFSYKFIPMNSIFFLQFQSIAFDCKDRSDKSTFIRKNSNLLINYIINNGYLFIQQTNLFEIFNLVNKHIRFLRKPNEISIQKNLCNTVFTLKVI